MALSKIGIAVNLKSFNELKTWIMAENRPIEIKDFIYPHVITSDSRDLIFQYQKALDGYGGEFGIHGPFFGLDIATPDPDMRKIVQKRLTKGLTICDALGATHMVVHSPFNDWHRLNRGQYPRLIPSVLKDMEICLSPILDIAEKIGCTLVLENCDDTDPNMRKQAISEINHPNFKISIDTGHAQLTHTNYSAPALVDFIGSASEDLAHVHLQDVDGYADRHWHPGDGVINWLPVLEAINKLNVAPRLVIEVRDSYHRIPKTESYLRNLINQTQNYGPS